MTNEISITNLFIGRNLKFIIKELYSIRNALKVKESVYLSKKFYNMKAEGQRIYVNDISGLNKDDEDFVPLLNEKDIGQEYPFINFKFVDKNFLDLCENDYFVKLDPSFLEFNSIDNIKDDIFKNDMKYEISLFNNLIYYFSV